MSNYLLLNQAFCQAHRGHSNDTGLFGFAVTLLGYYVAAEQTLYDFPELFENDTYLQGIIVIELATTDFPQQSLIP